MAKTVLLTGAAGFIGSHCVDYFLKNTDWNLICVDSYRHKGTHTRLNEVLDENQSGFNRVKIVTHDLSVPFDEQKENKILNKWICPTTGMIHSTKIDYIINMAANSAVERSTANPTECCRNNFELALNMLELARKVKPDKFLQISTDEIYGEAKPGTAHKEWATILPSNPYAASKACQEALAISYWRTYGVPVVITNTMNIIGEKQDNEKFLPKIIQKVLKGETVPIYGDDEANIGSRIYLDAQNKASALVFILKQPVAMYSQGAEQPDRYNICGDKELNNLEMAKLVAELMNKKLKWKLIPSESARVGYDRRYALDGNKLRQLGWHQPIAFEDTLKRIIDWTLKNPHWIV